MLAGHFWRACVTSYQQQPGLSPGSRVTTFSRRREAWPAPHAPAMLGANPDEEVNTSAKKTLPGASWHTVPPTSAHSLGGSELANSPAWRTLRHSGGLKNHLRYLSNIFVGESVNCGGSTGGEQDEKPETKLAQTTVRSFVHSHAFSSLSFSLNTYDSGKGFIWELGVAGGRPPNYLLHWLTKDLFRMLPK